MSTGAVIPDKPATDEATKKSLIDALIDALAVHDGILEVVSVEELPNNSFESYPVGGHVPSGWARTLLTAGAGDIETTKVVHGQVAYKFTRILGASNGGGYLESENFIPVGPGAFELQFFYEATAALQSTVEVRFYDAAQSYLSSVTAFTCSAATKYRGVNATGIIPGDARYAKIRLTGGTTSVDVAGSAYFDGFKFTTSNNSPRLSGTEYNIDNTSSVVESFSMFIPSDATTLSVTADVHAGSSNPTYYAKIGSNNGTSQTTSSATYVQKTSVITLGAGDKGKVVTVDLVCTTGTTAFLRATSSAANGYEEKLVIV